MAFEIKRYLRHWLAVDRRKVIDDAALQRLTEVVRQSEQKHTGEIRICVESRLPNSYLNRPHAMPAIARQRAVSQFAKLRVWDTQDNNGVLIYLLLAERAIEIVADRGLNPHATADDWKKMTQSLAEQLRQGNFEQGLVGTVEQVTDLLVRHFPLQAGQKNPNELPDSPSVQ